jgi:LCP family protein required for cell wall assembly
MRYVDLGVLPQSSFNKKKNNRKKISFSIVGLFILSIVAYFGYAFYWPISSVVSQILKNPGIALSFFRQPMGHLNSTDGKTNFLLLGIDKRDNVPYTYLGPNGREERNGFLSDTIIIASVDLKTKKISLVSIPRDTWVDISGWTGFPATEGKINSAYSLGDVYDYPGGGLKLAEKVVSDHTGVSIHYGARIDFAGFKKMTDTLGGVDVVVDKTFDDYSYPTEGREKANCPDGTYDCRYTHVHFDAGSTHMDGTAALQFARSREGTNGEGSDFARARRQQKVIQAVFKKAVSINTLLDPLKLNSLFKDFGESVETDFDLVSIPKLITLAKDVDMSSTRTFVVDPSTGLMAVPSPALYGGAYVIIPKNNDWGPVRAAIKDFLNFSTQ